MWTVSVIVIGLLASSSAQRVSSRNRGTSASGPVGRVPAPSGPVGRISAPSGPVAKAPTKQPQFPTYPEITRCEEAYGLQLYPHPLNCDQFYKCENSTLTLETCENGLLFDGKGGAVHNYCNYHWGANCEGREFELVPVARGICEYAFGIFAAGPCETYYDTCEYGESTSNPCTPGLVYDERIHGCNWPDLLEYCNPEQVVGFKCPEHIDPKDPAYKFLPFPRYPSGDCGQYITCVNGSPRLIGCGDYTVFNEETLGCEDPEYVPKCANYFK